MRSTTVYENTKKKMLISILYYRYLDGEELIAVDIAREENFFNDIFRVCSLFKKRFRPVHVRVYLCVGR